MEFCYLTLVSFVIYSRDMFRIQALEGAGGGNASGIVKEW